MVFAAYSTTSAASGPASSPSFSACFFAGSASLPPPSPPLLSSASAPAPLPPLQGPVPPGASLLGLLRGGTRGMPAPRTAAAAGGRGRGGGQGRGRRCHQGLPCRPGEPAAQKPKAMACGTAAPGPPGPCGHQAPLPTPAAESGYFCVNTSGPAGVGPKDAQDPLRSPSWVRGVAGCWSGRNQDPQTNHLLRPQTEPAILQFLEAKIWDPL